MKLVLCLPLFDFRLDEMTYRNPDDFYDVVKYFKLEPNAEY